METTTITNIRDVKNNIKELIKKIDKRQFSERTFGSESEFTYRGLLAGIDALMTDVGTLTRSPQEFLKISTYSERVSLLESLNNLYSYLEDPDYLLPHFDQVKVTMRNYSVRLKHDRFVEFENEIGEVLKYKISLQDALEKTKKIRSQYEKRLEEINSVFDRGNIQLESQENEIKEIDIAKNTLIEKTNSLDETITEIQSIKQKSIDELKEIENILVESRSNDKLISTFAKTILEKENKMEELEGKMNKNIDDIGTFQDERKKYLNEANALISSARKALSYKTAEGMSAAFQEKHDEEKKNWKQSIWIIAATISLAVTIIIGVWILKGDSADPLHIILGRIALLPFPIIAAVFCANQYVRRTTLIEDYAYKMVLAKSIVGFSEEIKSRGTETDNSEYVHYIKTVLDEIHKDPLRSRYIRVKSIKQNPTVPLDRAHIEALDKIVTIVNKVSKTDPNT